MCIFISLAAGSILYPHNASILLLLCVDSASIDTRLLDIERVCLLLHVVLTLVLLLLRVYDSMHRGVYMLYGF